MNLQDNVSGYNVLGRRVMRYTVLDGKEIYEKYFYDGADVVADYDGRTGEVRALYVTPFLDENLLKEDYTGPGPILAWYTQDGLGSVRQLVVGDSVMNSYAYTAWGVPLQWHETIFNRYTFTGREYNPETTLYHYRIREYSCILGRFNSSDILLLDRTYRDYLYCQNDPPNAVDPTGLQAAYLPLEHTKVFGGTKGVVEGRRYISDYLGAACVASGTNIVRVPPLHRRRVKLTVGSIRGEKGTWLVADMKFCRVGDAVILTLSGEKKFHIHWEPAREMPKPNQNGSVAWVNNMRFPKFFICEALLSFSFSGWPYFGALAPELSLQKFDVFLDVTGMPVGRWVRGKKVVEPVAGNKWEKTRSLTASAVPISATPGRLAEGLGMRMIWQGSIADPMPVFPSVVLVAGVGKGRAAFSGEIGNLFIRNRESTATVTVEWGVDIHIWLSKQKALVPAEFQLAARLIVGFR